MSPATGALILTVTRACDLRCSYCPTAKDGWPSLSPEDARRAVRLFAERYGGGDLKIFGGEPLLVPDVVDAALDEAEAQPALRRAYLSTNGLGLSPARLGSLARRSKLILTLSMDGAPEDHRRLRRATSPDTPDAYSHLVSLMPLLLRFPRMVVTQTVAPAAAKRAGANFAHLRGLGIRRFNLLPGYYLPWRPEQLAALEKGFAEIGEAFISAWRGGDRLYLRNLFTRAPTPFFNTGLVVDSDRTIHPSNIGLSGALDDTRSRTQVGDLDDPPSPEALAARALEINGLLQEVLRPEVWQSTLDVDAALTRLCRRLLPHWAALRRSVG
jgi:pyruvate-formate lyase-activating enzyme